MMENSLSVITGFNNEHNNERNEHLYKFLPRQRQLSGDEKRDVQAMLKVNANKKKLLQAEIMDKTGKVIRLKDLHNIGCALNNEKSQKINQN